MQIFLFYVLSVLHSWLWLVQWWQSNNYKSFLHSSVDQISVCKDWQKNVLICEFYSQEQILYWKQTDLACSSPDLCYLGSSNERKLREEKRVCSFLQNCYLLVMMCLPECKPEVINLRLWLPPDTLVTCVERQHFHSAASMPGTWRGCVFRY